MIKYLLIAFIIWNIAVFFVYGIDKYKARHQMHRISEKCLVLLSIFFGFVGATYGMIVFNHKTSKTKFRVLVPVSFIINIAIIILLTVYVI